MQALVPQLSALRYLRQGVFFKLQIELAGRGLPRHRDNSLLLGSNQLESWYTNIIVVWIRTPPPQTAGTAGGFPAVAHVRPSHSFV